MAYNYEYPYTDSSLYNMDWILNKIKSVDDVLAEAQRLLEEVQSYVEDAKKYTDEQCALLQLNIDECNNSIEVLRRDVNSKYDELAALINSNYITLDAKIDNSELSFEQKLAHQWQETLNAITHAADNITVNNFFTGQHVSLQSMFNYLAMFHLTNATNYNGVTGNQTYAYLEALNKDYTYATENSATMFL